MYICVCARMCRFLEIQKKKDEGNGRTREANEHNCMDKAHIRTTHKEKSERHYATPQEIKCVREVIGRK